MRRNKNQAGRNKIQVARNRIQIRRNEIQMPFSFRQPRLFNGLSPIQAAICFRADGPLSSAASAP
jgi:hypothetical protein